MAFYSVASAHQGVTGRPLGCLPTDTPFNYNISEAHGRGLTTLTCPLPVKMASMTTEVMGCLPLSHLRSFRCGGQSRPGQDRNLTQPDTTEREHVRGIRNSVQFKSVRASVFAAPIKTCWAKILHFYNITRSLLGRQERREKCWPGGFQHA